MGKYQSNKKYSLTESLAWGFEERKCRSKLFAVDL